MRTVAFVSQKGGCGKSTLAACLAVAAQEAGERVLVLDMDPKKSVVRWGSKRNDPHLPVEAVSAARLPAALTALSKRNLSLVVVDTPVLESPRSLAAIKSADLCIVPARPATFDIWASEVTGRKLCSCTRNSFFSLTNVRLSAKPHVCKRASPRLKPLGLFYVPTSPRGPTFSKPRAPERA
jgi:chromosome partitioning protein